MNIHDLQRTGLLGSEADSLNIESPSSLPFSRPTQQLSSIQGATQSPHSSMSIVSHLTSPPVAGSHAGVLHQRHLQNTAGVAASQSVLGSYPKGIPPHSHLGHHRSGHRVGGRMQHSQDYYCRKLKRLKRLIKDTVFINASVCDEVIRTEDKLARSKEERRFLLRKLLQYQSLTETSSTTVKQEVTAPVVKVSKSPSVASSTTSEGQTTAVTVDVTATTPVPSKSKSGKKKVTSGGTVDKKKITSTKELLDSLQPKAKKSKTSGASRRTAIPPIPLDPTGRPIFPLVMGDLTVHSLGELNLEKSCFHCAESIYPVGFCSTRVYANMNSTDIRCLYTCKISDSGTAPVFEIAPDDNPEKVWKSRSPGECHTLLTRAIIKSKGVDLTPNSVSGLDFFGLSHPIVQNLIQSLPGARKCSGYKWHKFEVNKGEVISNIAHCRTDPVINFDALRKIAGTSTAGSRTSVQPAAIPLEPSTSLRSLLTSGPFSTGTFSQQKQ